MHEILPGEPYPLGATVDSEGTNFALFSDNATSVEVCLFDETGVDEVQRIALPECTDSVWHGYISGIKAGALYGYRVNGPFDPHNGHRFNVNKLLIDPYTKQLSGKFIPSETHFNFDRQAEDKDLVFDKTDNAKFLPKCVVCEPLPTYTNNKHSKIDDTDTIIYELHVKGFTQQNTNIATEIRGTFSGLSEKTVIDYLKDLGISTVELMPVIAFFDETELLEKNLSNYWGYNSVAFLAPEPRYCASNELSEFQKMVSTFHQAGIEVILDVVYNHTAEGNHLGPTYSFKGIDNASYYRLDEHNPRYYINYSGCGNTLNIQHPRVLQLVMDSLRYWVEIMGVDGFRFDLATILGRGRADNDAFDHYGSFFAVLGQDPVLSKCKFIAEPWDVGPEGYQLGNFPEKWMEWNDHYRDTVRKFWRSEDSQLPELAKRLHGSNDIFSNKGHRANSSINFITAHDGFTLEDMVSFNNTHNTKNGENNCDGHKANFSANYGCEGKTDNQQINALRTQQKRNLLLTLMLSQGTPMLLAGDEFNNSQHGNNNAYCQDNAVSWLNWDTLETKPGKEQYAFVRKLISLRKEEPLINRSYYQHGDIFSNKTGLADISWLNANGQPMQDEEWHNHKAKCLAILLGNVEKKLTLSKGNLEKKQHCAIENIKNDALLIIFNASHHSQHFICPDLPGIWKLILNTVNPFSDDDMTNDLESRAIDIAPHSSLVLAYSQKN
ncbi:MAG: glycogen debranching protein GlgX [Gammaproteobacteria bacterium]|nr:glycogen debranching protein GlgX [Gammaproteobacteria bacterium]